jgi:adenosylcobinamide kinase/adenosylcobinamide-phosphate guanylyltransferase
MSSIFITGGARAGKSRLAQKLATEAGGKVLFVATAEARDEDMRFRIEEHRKNRPADWEILEAPTGVGKAIREHIGVAPVVVIDCITMLVSNVMLQAQDKLSVETEVFKEIDALIKIMAEIPARFILVSNEVGLGIVPDNELARTYRDCLGKVNQILAQNADEVYFLAVGIPIKIK